MSSYDLGASLTRIRVVDLETTGFAPTDSIVEIGAVDLIGNDIVLVGSQLVRPPCPIPPHASAVHHITDEQVSGCPPIEEQLPFFLDFDRSANVEVFCAHNWRFEAQWLGEKLDGRAAVCTLKAALRVWPDAPAHNNQALRYWLKPQGLDPLIATAAHRALPDAYVTALILRELLKHVCLEDMISWTKEPALLPRVNFGKHRGLPWTEVPTDYLNWILERSDQNEDVKFTAAYYRRARSTRRREFSPAQAPVTEPDAVA